MIAHKAKPKKASILIVEDEVIVAIELREKLRALGWRVSGLATSGAEALAAAEADPPDLILMDVTIKGGMDGVDTASRLQAKRRVPVVFITAFPKKPAPRRTAGSRPPFFWLSKPLVDEELVRTIRTALAGKGETALPIRRRRARPAR
jgi:CheY-like chemotaxis protein